MSDIQPVAPGTELSVAPGVPNAPAVPVSQAASTSRPPGIAEDVLRRLKDAETPLDFIKANLRQPVAPVAPAVQQAVAQVAAVAPVQPMPVIHPDGTQLIQQVLSETIPKPTETVPKPDETVAPLGETITPEDEPLTEDELKGPEKSIKDLRKKVHETAASLTQKEQELEDTKKKLQAYETGEATPEPLEQARKKITELEYYQHLHAFRLSPEYQQNFVLPSEQLKAKAEKLAQDYQVSPAFFDAAVGIENKRDLNAFLRQHFDDVGALEARQVIEQWRDLSNKAVEAEKKPAQALETIKSQSRRENEARESVRVNSIIRNSKDGWMDALTELRATESYPELTFRNDPQHDKIVEGIIEVAAKEYGKYVKQLGELGIKDIPAATAKMTAKTFLTAYAAAVIAKSREEYYKHSQTVIEESKRRSSMMRPPVGRSSPGSVAEPRQPMTPTQGAELLLKKIGM